MLPLCHRGPTMLRCNEIVINTTSMFIVKALLPFPQNKNNSNNNNITKSKLGFYVSFNSQGHIGTGPQLCHLWDSNQPTEVTAYD